MPNRCPLCTHYRDQTAYWQELAATERERADKAEAKARLLEQALFQAWLHLRDEKAQRRLAG